MSVPPRPGDDSALSPLWIALPAAAFALLAALVAVSDSNAAWFIAGNAAARDWLPAAVWAGITNFGSTLGAFAPGRANARLAPPLGRRRCCWPHPPPGSTPRG